MKHLFSAICGCLIISGYTQEVNIYELLKEDYKSATIVAHVRVQFTKIVHQDGLYAKRFVSCQITESFKGNVRRGQILEYYEQGERDSSTVYPRQAIVFLKSNRKDRTNSKKEVWAIFNSTRKYTKEIVLIMRRIKSLHSGQINSSNEPTDVLSTTCTTIGKC